MAVNPKKHEMPTQAPEVRAHNFEEVAQGYSMEIAREEAARCLNCKNRPCVEGCPVNINIPDFIQQIKQGNLEEAYRIISLSSSLPAVCGRVCPQETQCESRCTLHVKAKMDPVGIGRLERFAADWHHANAAEKTPKPEPNGHQVAIVGAGPSGLTCAGDLAKKGYQVTVYEALHTAGGVLVYGIPEFRLPKAIVAREVETLKELGVKVETNVIIGKTLTVDELFEMGFEAVFIGSGAGLPNFMNIPGEALKGVYSANEFLTRSNLMKAYRENPRTPIMKGGSVAVVGGGNVAMDAARTALRLGAEKVYIIYRRKHIRYFSELNCNFEHQPGQSLFRSCDSSFHCFRYKRRYVVDRSFFIKITDIERNRFLYELTLRLAVVVPVMSTHIFYRLRINPQRKLYFVVKCHFYASDS